MTREETVQEFHEVFNHPVDTKWTPEQVELRCKLIAEESQELFEEFFSFGEDKWKSIDKVSKARVLKELADLQYVISGLAVTLGLPLEEAFVRVHKSNMSKLNTDGKPLYRDDGKVLKGPDYLPPVLDDLVE